MTLVLISIVILLLLLLLSVPVASTIAGISIIVGYFFSDYPVFSSIGEITWSVSTDYLLLSIPFFVLLGEILLHSGIAKNIYFALHKWLSWLPGGLLHANIASSAIFSSISGSSVATAATITTVAMPQCEKHGYKEGLFAGTIAAGGTLGILIPPSINLIVYGFLTNTSIPKLFMAGLLPGMLMAILFMLFILVYSLLKKEKEQKEYSVTWKERFIALRDLLPIFILFVLIMGSIYTGIATPTESAALGVLFSLAITYFSGLLNFEVIKKSIKGTMRTTGMIMFIIIAANFLNFVLVSIGLTDDLSDFIEGLAISKYTMLVIVTLLFIVLGLFIETLSLMVITIPIIAPVMITLGFDPIWFGIYLIILIEMALITPPVGLNLYVVQGIRNKGSIIEVMKGCIPFVLIMLLMSILLVFFPEISLYFVNFA
ncbi:TRAP dicarboxylate transporter, DctM subunit [Arcobacter nitrofigilis DSM 7299]|uniref:TRAP dicarboxylate transporter, DctM subunit n=1 Tax=Arcobacter nitrofigilis (strain ATCC 33309 / DSM 7299 / CCUG 15893 / LMG 7604 / NCTC 12251 / CI) TaxID=572480 RepID=D5V4P1_ARCNC|nr:TRAP transporter large permease [Arcobacter nitrofigilis]ADG92946.1 TRAP dicarboxylate transporter, DctM subunit [Arcobacter nitrofigilis DSM 7299]